METKRDEWSLRRPTNAIIVGTLWVMGVIATFVEGFSWQASAIAAGTGVLFGLVYSPRRYWQRLLAFMILLFCLSGASVSWRHGHSLGADILLDAQFFAIGLTFALLVGVVRRSVDKSADTADAGERS